jgi:hypothetical protein
MPAEITTLWSRPDSTGVRLSHFAVGSHSLKPPHIAHIEKELGPKLRKSGSIHLVGLASRSGSAALNQALSKRRSDAVLAQLRKVAGSGFKVIASDASGEQAAALAGAKDGTEDPNFRAVIVMWWSKLEPPPPTEPPPEPPKFVQRYGSKTVWLPENGSKNFEDKGDTFADVSRKLRNTLLPDRQVVNDGPVLDVPDTYVVREIRTKLHQKSGPIPGGATSQWYEVRFIWGPRIGSGSDPIVDVYTGPTLDESVSIKVAQEIYEHPGHYLLRPRQRGTSGWSP